MTYLRLFWEFFKTGLFAVGGGMATVPFLKNIGLATGWYSQTDLMNMLAVSESTPGPIGINMATYVGFTVAGIPGAVIATIGEVTPSIIVILIVAAMLTKFRNSKYVENAFYGLRPASSGLIGAACAGVVLQVLLRVTSTAVPDSLFMRFSWDGTVSWMGLALAAVLCTGCGVKDEDLKSDPLVNADGTAPVGKTLVAPAPPEGFTLLDNKDILAANGLYYASWVNGEPQPYENSEGKTVNLYDAQLTLVVQENKTEEKAASAVSGWQELAQQNYDISDTQTLTAAGQEYTVIQFTYQDESNPYATGVAAFAQRGTSAIEWELSCQESYTGDALAVLTEFLNGCTY